jgi:hypothetical protein
MIGVEIPPPEGVEGAEEHAKRSTASAKLKANSFFIEASFY